MPDLAAKQKGCLEHDCTHIEICRDPIPARSSLEHRGSHPSVIESMDHGTKCSAVPLFYMHVISVLSALVWVEIACPHAGIVKVLLQLHLEVRDSNWRQCSACGGFCNAMR